jgi:hypothetical protein
VPAGSAGVFAIATTLFLGGWRGPWLPIPGLTEELKFAVVSGAMVAGGLTVIANAPNPAGQAILGRFFPSGVSPLHLALGAIVPTMILAACFLLLP